MIKILKHAPKVMLILMIICSVLAYILNSHELLAATFCGMIIFIMVYLAIVAVLESKGLL